MRRFIAVVLAAAVLITLCLTLTGCDAPKVRVESQLKINEDFKGSRTVTVIYPLSADIDAVKEELLADSPLDDNIEGVDFAYVGATENGYIFELSVSFNNLEEYEKRISSVIGRDANAVLARKDTAMFSGTRVKEDFDVAELIGWIVRDTGANDVTKDYTFEYPDNKVTVGKDAFETGSTVNVNEGKGIPVDSVDVKTYNEKAGLFGRTFDRSFVFSIPADTYTANKQKIGAYFEELAGDAAQISDTHEGNHILYTVIYEGLSLSELETTTGTLLDSSGVSIYYGDKENMSTPLYEGRVLEETLDTLSFCNADGNAPTLKYTYSLPTNAVRGEGALYRGGVWEDAGIWDDGAYRLEDTTGLTHLRIFDGRRYYIDGVDVELTAVGERKFRRVTSFLFPIEDGLEGPAYAAKFFQSKGAETASDNDGAHVLCSVISEGTPDELNTALETIFGKGNHIVYSRKDGALSDKTTYVDNIDLREMLSIENATVDLTYTASAENGENIVTLINGGKETAYQDKKSSKITVKGCVAAVGYHGVIPKAGNILLYIIFGAVLFAVTTLIAYRMLVPPIRRERASFRRHKPDAVEDMTVPAETPQPSAAQDTAPSAAPSQTTTFSIFELGILSRNKKYVEEINKDVEDRLHAEQLEKQKKALRQKELEELEKKVYGADDLSAAPAPAAEQEPAINEAFTADAESDMPRTIEILDTFDKASKAEPEPPAPTDPMELLNLMNEDGEDGDA